MTRPPAAEVKRWTKLTSYAYWMAVTKVSTVRVPKAGEMVASQLRRQIVLGELKEGDQLPSESVLMEQFGVSRPTLREAFRILEAEGAITVRRGVRGGARVQVPDINVAARHIGLLLQYRGALLSDVYEIRAVLERAAARMTAKRRTSADLARLQEVLDRHRESIDDPGASIAADAEFHRLIVEMSGSETLQILVGMLDNIIREGDRSYAESHDWQRQQELAKIAIRAHTRLVELIRKRAARKPKSSGASTWPSRPRWCWATAPRPRWWNCSPEATGSTTRDGHPGDQTTLP